MIQVEDLTHYYGETRALDGVSFGIEDRSVVGFLGLNGAGKSTILKILGGLLMPSGGSVAIDGVDTSDAPDALRQKIGFLPETPPLYEDMYVSDFLAWCGRIKGADSGDIEARVAEVAQICDIADKVDSVISSLSHGYRKRVGIAQAIIHRPELVILDEPISGLDPVQIVQMRGVVERLREESTVLVSSHILSEISETCDRILVLHDGRLVADGTEEELAQRLGGGVRLELALRGAREAVAEVLDAHDWIGDWAWDDEDGEDGDIAELGVTLTSDRREELVAALVGADIGVRRVDEAESELEQTFLGVTGGEEADAADATDTPDETADDNSEEES